MLKLRIVTFSGLLSLALAACQLVIGTISVMAAAKTDQKVSANVALPGVQVETLNPYGHSTTQIYPTWKHVIEPLVEWNWTPACAAGWPSVWEMPR